MKDAKMMLKTLLVITLCSASRANTVSLTQGQTCGQSVNNASLTLNGRTYVCSDQCPRTYLAVNGTSVYNGTSLLESTFELGKFPCLTATSSPLISRPGNIGCYLALINDELRPVSAWSFHVELTNENGVLMSSVYGDIILANKRVQVRSPDGNNAADIGQVIDLNRKTHFIIMMRRQLQNVFVDVYIDGVHSGSTISYPAPFLPGALYDVSFGGCDFCGSSSDRSLQGQIEDIRKFEDGLSDREARALYNGSLPKVTPSTFCLCPPSYPFDVTSASGTSYICTGKMQQGPPPPADELVSRFYNATSEVYYSDVTFLTDGMTSAFPGNLPLLPAFWMSEFGPVTFSVQFPTQPSIIRSVRIYLLSDLPSGGIWIYKEPSSVLLHVVGDCAQAGVQSMAYVADDVTCTDIGSVLPDTTPMEWNALDRPGVNTTMMTSSVMQHLMAHNLTIEFRGSPRSGQTQHAISEIQVDARPPPSGNMCQCYVQQSKSCKCSCKSKDASTDLAAKSCEPQVDKIYPEIGNVAGGGVVTISGKNLIPNVTEVTIGRTPCTIQSRDERRVVCKTGNVSSPMSDQPVKITLANGFFLFATEKFQYLRLPTIDSIQPLEIFDSGGRMVTVTGTNLGVPGASLTLQKLRNGKSVAASSSPCVTQSDTQLVCPTPDIDLSSYSPNDRGLYNSGKNFVMGVTWPDVPGLDNMAAATALGQKTFQPRIFASPKIAFKDDTAVFRAYESEEFIFQGENLLSDLVSKDDYSVKVGGNEVEVLDVTETTLTCKLPKSQPDAADPEFERNTLLLAQVDAGVTSVKPGYIKWFDTIWDDVAARIAILCAVFAVLMVILVIVLTILSRAASKKEKKKAIAPMLPTNPPLPAKATFEDQYNVAATGDKLINMVDAEHMGKLKKCLVTDSDSLSRSGAHVRGNFGEIVHGEYMMPNPGNIRTYIKIIRDRSRSSQECDLESHLSKVDGYLRDAGVLAGLLPKDFHNHLGMGKPILHANVHTLIGLAFSGSRAFFVYPRCKSTDLKFYLRHPDVHCTVASLLGFVKDIAKGMEYLHTRDIIHGDVAARNCVVTDEDKIAISDAVLSDDFYPEDYSQPLGGTAFRSFPIRWMSPRYLEKGTCSYFGDDIYAFGITVWEVITRCMFPYADITNQAVLEEVPEGMRPEQPHHCPDEVFDLMTNCWSPNFKLRPSFEYILNTLEVIGNPQRSTPDEIIELNSRSPPEVFQQEVTAPHVTLANSGGAYFNLAFKNDRDVTTNM